MSGTDKKRSGPSGRKPPTYVTFTQQLKPEFWPGWDPALILSGDMRLMGEETLRRHTAAGGDSQGLWLMRHSKDRLADGSLKDDHMHGIIEQSEGTRTEGKLHCDAIDRALGFVTSVVRAPSRGGRITNAQAYLIHAKDPDKFQYVPDEVVTIRGRDYLEIEAENRRAWARRAVVARNASVSMKEWAEMGDALIQKVLDGEVDELDLLRDKALMDIYTRNETKVNLAFKVRAKSDMLFEVEKLRAGTFKKTIVWALGASNQGKSYLVESAAAELSARTGWRIFRATAKNGPDAYNGEQIFMMNEPSSRVMEWADFLQLLDPQQGGPISARYYNKPDAAPRLILIAVSVDPVEFGFFIPGKRSADDSMDQLVRRVTLSIEARKIEGEPHYSVSRIGEVDPYGRSIRVPGRDGSVPRPELVILGYGNTDTLANLTHAEALDAVLDTVAVRSPDAGIVTSAHRHFAEVTASAASRGIVFTQAPALEAGAAA
jgi:hypothetical protein